MRDFEGLYLADRLCPFLENLNPLKSALFDKQQSYYNSPSKKKAALCSRRAGKTHVVGTELNESLLDLVEGDAAYITLTRRMAKQLMFKFIKRLQKKNNFPYHFDAQELTITNTQNENTLFITGANTEDDVEKLRGLKLKRAVCDEVASFRNHLNYMIEEVIEPALLDLDGVLELIGTPSANPTNDNLFYRITSGQVKGWDVHHWTVLDNPFIPNARAWLEKRRIDNGWDMNNPKYLREWCGVWVTDSEGLVYQYDRSRNDSLPQEEWVQKWYHVMGVDLGYHDAFTVVVWRFSLESENLYAVKQIRRPGLKPYEMAEILKGLKEEFKPMSTVADTGGLGKAIVEEFNDRYGLQIKPAEKTKKQAYIELFNSDLLTGKIKIPYGSYLQTEMSIHQWNPEKPDKEDDRTPNDVCDAALYGWREAKHFRGQKTQKPPEKNSDEYFREVERKLEEEMAAKIERDIKKDWLGGSY